MKNLLNTLDRKLGQARNKTLLAIDNAANTIGPVVKTIRTNQDAAIMTGVAITTTIVGSVLQRKLSRSNASKLAKIAGSYGISTVISNIVMDAVGTVEKAHTTRLAKEAEEV